MRVLVTYLSDTGNTKKVADAIYGEIAGEKEIKPFSDVASLDTYDLCFVGFPIQKGGVPAGAKAFLESRCDGQNVALFVTHASPEESPMAEAAIATCREAAAGVRVVDLFHCQGELGAGVKHFMLNSGVPQLRAWAEADNSQGQPDEARLDRAREFARGIVRG